MNDNAVFYGNTIMVRPNGPLICKSDTNVIVKDHEGRILRRDKELALCRCGKSNHKPFCDGTHKTIGFQANEEFTDEKSENLPDCSGELIIVVKQDAMLSIQSPVTLHSRSGKSTTTRSKGALCRCGHSRKKPFCDISHKKYGFKGASE